MTCVRKECGCEDYRVIRSLKGTYQRVQQVECKECGCVYFVKAEAIPIEQDKIVAPVRTSA